MNLVIILTGFFVKVFLSNRLLKILRRIKTSPRFLDKTTIPLLSSHHSCHHPSKALPWMIRWSDNFTNQNNNKPLIFMIIFFFWKSTKVFFILSDGWDNPKISTLKGGRKNEKKIVIIMLEYFFYSVSKYKQSKN